MTAVGALSIYTGAILLGALAGGALPLFASVRRSDLLLSFSAGVMLGAAFFHMLPEAVELGGSAVVPFVVVGFLVLGQALGVREVIAIAMVVVASAGSAALSHREEPIGTPADP